MKLSRLAQGLNELAQETAEDMDLEGSEAAVTGLILFDLIREMGMEAEYESVLFGLQNAKEVADND